MTVLVRELGLQEPLDTDKMRRSNRIGCAEFFQSFVASVKRILIRVGLAKSLDLRWNLGF